jgi:two-component system, OmpR family, sensor histidine kinase MtrB
VPEVRHALEALRRVAIAAQGESELPALLRRICEQISESFGFERVAVSRYDQERDEAIPLVAVGAGDEEELAHAPRGLEHQPLLRTALRAGELVCDDARCILPLLSAGRCLGFLGADHAGSASRLDARASDLLTTMGVFLATLLEKGFVADELRRLDELKSRFVSIASHELRTPAAVIYGTAETLFRRGDDLSRERLNELHEALLENARWLRSLVEQLLDLSRVEAGAVRLEPRPLDVRGRVLSLVRLVGGEREDEIEVEVPDGLAATVDHEAFERILTNLLGNALLYGKPPIRVSAEQRDRHFRLVVEDRGRGVAPEFVPRLFERFTRSASSTEERRGAGLGLAIARTYARAHDGDLLYEPARPTGARFLLVLPQPVSGREGALA